MVSPQAKREAVRLLMAAYEFGVTRACGLVRISRSLYGYRRRRPERAGLRETKRGRGTVVPGDVLQEIDGKPVNTSDEFLGRLGNYRPGDTVTLTLWRDGQVRRVKAVLEAAE